MMAALKGNTANIHSLLEHNADGNLRNVLGQSALDIAIAMGHEEAAEILLSDNKKLNKQVSDLSTGITVREMGGSKTYMLTEANEARTTQSEEPSLQLRDFTENTEKISQNLCLLDRPSQYLQLAGPQLRLSADLDDVAASNTSTSISRRGPNVTPKARSPRIAYCISCCRHHPPDISQCLKKKFSTITKSDTLLPVHTMCQLDSIIRKPQSETDKKTEGAVESFRHKPSLSGRQRLTRFLSAIKQALKFKRNVRRSFNTSHDYSVRRRTDSPPSNKYVDQSIKHTESSADTAPSPLSDLDFRHSNLEVSRLPNRTLSPHISAQTGDNKTQAYRSRVRVTSPQSNTGIHDYNWTHRALSPQTNTHVLENTCRPSTQIRDNYFLEEGYKTPSIPCSLYHPSVATQDLSFHNDRQHICSHKQNIDVEHSTKHTHRLTNTEFSPLSNIDTHTLSSRTHSPLSNTKTDSLPDTAYSSFSSTEPYRLSYPSSMDIHSILDRTLSAPSHVETYSLADGAFPSQGNCHTDQNKSQMDTILNRAHSPITNLHAYISVDRACSSAANLNTYSSADRVHSPAANLQTYISADRIQSPVVNLNTYSSADRVHSSVVNLHAYSSAERVHSPAANLQTYSSAERVCSSVANLWTDSSADRVHSPVPNLYTCSSADGVHSPVANLKTSAAREHSPVANLKTYNSADRVHSPVANSHTYSSAERVHSRVANLKTSADRVHSPVANLYTYSSADGVHSPVANLKSSAARVHSPVANLHTYSSAERVHSPVANLKDLQFSRPSTFSCS